MYFESSVAINVLSATLYFSFGRLLSPACQVPVMAVNLRAPQLHSRLRAPLLHSPLRAPPQAPVAPGLSWQEAPSAGSPSARPSRLSSLRAGPGRGPALAASGCSVWEGAEAERCWRSSPRCAAKAVFTRARPQKQSAVCEEPGPVQNTLSSVCTSAFVQHIPACR